VPVSAFVYDNRVAFDATVPLGKWDASKLAWPCDFASYPGAKIKALHIGAAATQKAAWQSGEREVRWLDQTPPPADGEGAWVELSVPGRMDTKLLIAICGLIGTLGGAAITAGVTAYTNTCAGDLDAAKASIASATKQNIDNSQTIEACKDSLSVVTNLCQ
jgi:hypothetical protein